MTRSGTVLVTRPAGQQEAILEALHQAGFTPLHVPALAIEPLPVDDRGRALAMDLDQFHAVIFISANAAHHGLDALSGLWPQWPLGVHWLAVGDSTAAVLRDHGLAPELPADGYNSEALLELAALADVNERRVLIVSGEGGRDLLARTLTVRGAKVDVLPVYRRVYAGFRWPAQPVDAVMVTSEQGWQCIRGQVPEGCLVVAGSPRIAEAVRADGFRDVLTATSPRDPDMVAALASRKHGGE